MRDFGAMRGAPWTVGDILRRMLLSWLTAVLVQYLSLRAELRRLEGGWRLGSSIRVAAAGHGSISFLYCCPSWPGVLKRFG